MVYPCPWESFIAPQKGGYSLHELLPLLEVRHMARLSEPDPLHILNFTKVRLNDLVLRFVVAAVDEQRRAPNLVDLVDDIPRLERARDIEFRGTVPEKISRIPISANEIH